MVSDKKSRDLPEEALEELEFHSVLNKISKYCISSLGKDIILKLRPGGDIFFVNEEHALIDESMRLFTEDDRLPLENLNDIRSQLYKSLVENAVLNTGEILNVLEVMRVSRLVQNFLYVREEKYPKLFENSVLLHQNRLLEKHITEAIDETGTVRDTASRELSRIRREIFNKSNILRKRLQVILKRVSEEDMVQEEFITLREGRFVLPVKAEHKRHIPGIIHGLSQTGSTVFLEPSEIFEMNNEISLLMNEEKREIYRILSNLTAEIGYEAREFLRSLDVLARLDSIAARANYALEFGGIKPEIWEHNEIYLKDIRHPLLVHVKGRKKVQPLSIDFDGNIRGHLISGPNAGGKTVALKSIGLNVAMALSGIFPLGVCKTNYRTIFAAIGDHQSIENDLSTFSSQILHLKDILAECTSESLVLIDEILSGTDPQEGAALAAGILDTYINLNLFFVVTTHQTILKSYALTRKEIENASLEFNEKELKPTYQFLRGIPGNSYAFVLAESLGLPSTVLDRAKSHLGTKQTQLEESIAEIQRYRSQAAEFKHQAEEEKKNAEKARLKFEEKFNDIKMRRQEYIDKAKQEAMDIISESNALVEKTIKQVQEEKKSFATIKKEYNREKDDLERRIKKTFRNEHKSREREKKHEKIRPGDHVMPEDSTSRGEVIEVNEENGTALVDFNGFKFRLPMKQLIKTEEKKTPKREVSDHFKFDVKTRIDLRGKRADESIKEIDEFISNAIVSNVTPLTIIHGKGTGALREAIHEYLKHNRSVKSYRLGELVEGGAGVTVVELN